MLHSKKRCYWIGLHIIHLKQYNMYHYTHGKIFNMYEGFIFFHFRPKSVIYTQISWDFRNINTPNMMKYLNFSTKCISLKYYFTKVIQRICIILSKKLIQRTCVNLIGSPSISKHVYSPWASRPGPWPNPPSYDCKHKHMSISTNYSIYLSN